MHKYFGEILIEKGKLTKEQVQKALTLQKDNPERKMGEILVTLNYIEYDDIIDTIKKQYKISDSTPPGIDKWLEQDEIDKIINSAKDNE